MQARDAGSRQACNLQIFKACGVACHDIVTLLSNAAARTLNSHSMDRANIEYSHSRNIPVEQLVKLYEAVAWSSAEKPEALQCAMAACHSVITAWDGNTLVGLANAISDGHLVVYYPHLLVHPQYQRRGIGRQLMRVLMARYDGFHQQVLIADGQALDFYRKCGFVRAGKTEPMWIYSGHDH